MKVSYFSKQTDTKNPIFIEIDKIFSWIREGKYREDIEEIREIQKQLEKDPDNKPLKHQKDSLKRNLLSVVFQGLFKSRSNKGLLIGSELATLDFDHTRDVEFVRDHYFYNFKFVYATFISPSGDGVKVIARIPRVNDDNEYKSYYLALLKYFNNAKSDQATKDISRICYISYDPKIRVRDWNDTSVFTETIADDVTLETEVYNQEFTGDVIEKVKDMICQAPDGNKHYTLLKASRLMGGYVASGGCTENQAEDILFTEISKRSISDSEGAKRTIQDGIRFGKITPLTIKKELKQQPRKQDKKIREIKNQPYDMPYIRVGISYYKKITKHDRFGILRTELKVWNKQEIIEDHGKGFLQLVPKYDDFTIVPDNINYKPIINNCYNLYKPFSHKPRKGDWEWSEYFMRHIFGDQYDLGMRYMQALYCNPDHILPVLALLSEERQTGKTTFINWLSMIFGSNMVNIAPESLTGNFNFNYAQANIIAIEETLFDRTHAVDRIKSVSTSKTIDVNPKGVNQFQVPFYGKLILTSNSEDKVLKIDQNEIRFFIRKIPVPTKANHNIENDLMKEIPAFLYHLSTLPPIDWSKDRTGFTPDEIGNASLIKIKEKSFSNLYKNLYENFYNLFLNELSAHDFMVFDAKSIKELWFSHNNSIDIAYINDVLLSEFKLKKSINPCYISPLNSENKVKVRYYKLEKQYFKEFQNEEDGTDGTEWHREDVPTFFDDVPF